MIQLGFLNAHSGCLVELNSKGAGKRGDGLGGYSSHLRVMWCLGSAGGAGKG